jgi:DNA repair exonuclease SbcCD ATPase subunit
MTPKEKLDALEKELTKALAASEGVAKLKAQIAALKKLIADQETGENQYAREYAGVVLDQTKKKALADTRAEAVNKNTTQGDRDRVKAAIDEVDNKIRELGGNSKTATEDADKASKILSDKKDATKKAQDNLAALKEPWKPAQQALKEADALIASADQQIQAKNYLVAYFLVSDTNLSIAGANLDKPDDYIKKLSAATDAVFDSTSDEQTARDGSDAKAAAKTAAQKAYDDAKAKRQDNIIRHINEGSPATATGSTTGAASTTGAGSTTGTGTAASREKTPAGDAGRDRGPSDA